MTKKLYAALLAATFAATVANAAPVTESATARANILQNITVTNVDPLDFGTIVVGTTGGSVDVDADDGTVTCAAALSCTGTATAASFNVTGTGGAIVTLSGDDSVELTNANGDTMNASLSRSGTTLTLSAGGTGSFTVGGSLGVGASQPDGAYSGSFDVEVDYQ